MKRRDLINRLGRAADKQGVTFSFLREGASHSIYSFGGRNVAIPRHAEINEITAKSILRKVGA